MLEWIGHELSLFFVAQSDLCSRCNVRSELFFVYGCGFFHIFYVVVFVFFYSRHLYFYVFYLISKGIFHLGGLVSKMHISLRVIYRMEVLLFFSFIEYNLGIMNIQCIL